MYTSMWFHMPQGYIKAQSGSNNQQLKAPTSLECWLSVWSISPQISDAKKKTTITRYPCLNLWVIIAAVEDTYFRTTSEIKNIQHGDSNQWPWGREKELSNIAYSVLMKLHSWQQKNISSQFWRTIRSYSELWEAIT